MQLIPFNRQYVGSTYQNQCPPHPPSECDRRSHTAKQPFNHLTAYTKGERPRARCCIGEPIAATFAQQMGEMLLLNLHH